MAGYVLGMSELELFEPPPGLPQPAKKDILAVAEKLDILYKEAREKRRYIHLRLRFEKGKIAQAESYVAFAKPIRAKDVQSVSNALADVLKRAERPLPSGWSFDSKSLAAALLTVVALEDERIGTLSFRADFRKIAGKNLFHCWIDHTKAGPGKNYPQWHKHYGNIASVSSTNATAAVAQATAEALVALEMEALAEKNPPPPKPPKTIAAQGSAVYEGSIF